MPRIAILALLLAAAACSPQPEQAADPEPVYNPALDIRLAGVPEGFTVTTNAGDRLELRPVADDPDQPAPEGLVTFAVGPEESGVNLVAAVQRHQEEVESRPGGEYLGARELGGPLGVVFYSRGRQLTEDGRAVEETVLYAIHPAQSRLLEIRYRYPAGEDSSGRVTSLIGLLAEIEVPQADGEEAANGEGST